MLHHSDSGASAICKAYHEKKILHCDISLGNAMLTKAFEGILNDWDHSREVSANANVHPFRTVSSSLEFIMHSN